MLQQPVQDAFNFPGPGAYLPLNTFTSKAGPAVDFSTSSGRMYMVPDIRSAADALAPGDHFGETVNPKAYLPVPSSTHPPKLYSSIPAQRPAYLQSVMQARRELRGAALSKTESIVGLVVVRDHIPARRDSRVAVTSAQC